MNINRYPDNTAVSIKLGSLIKHTKNTLLSEKMSSRMVKCASVLDENEFIGWQMEIPRKGLVDFTIFGSQMLAGADLEWIAEKTGKTAKDKRSRKDAEPLDKLYELYLPVTENCAGSKIGFNAEVTGQAGTRSEWPTAYSSQFAELLRVLQNGGAVFRALIGPASDGERELCRKHVLKNWRPISLDVNDYIGRPVKARFLIRLPSAPSVRFQTVLEEAVAGIKLRFIGEMSEYESAHLWDDPLADAAVLPDYAARIMLMEPELSDTAVGVEVCEEPVKPIPVSHKNTKMKGAVTIGMAVDTAGIRREITIGEMDLKRHYQIVGQTGTGKSSLLVTLMLSAIAQGHGLTCFDPHGSTVDVLLRSIPEKYAGKVRVVRIGDAENPVPLNIWDSGDLAKEERNISDLCELFSDIFDPKREGIVGPRYERWLSTFAKASIAALGRMASLESIAVISQSQDNMLKVCKAIVGRYPDLVERIKQEYGLDASREFHNELNYYLAKFERLTSIEQLRKTLGAGANALDFGKSIDTDCVTLIDLASPVIGPHAARIVGTLLLMKLWNAAMTRRERDRLHMVVVDEASLFQTNPMPRMLAEARKFGISLCLCHQHAGQLTQEIRDALEANSASFSAFRLSTMDAANAAIRFDDPEAQISLPRLDAFRAMTTLSVDGRQTQPFTLEIDRPKRQKNAEQLAESIERMSVQKLVEPYRHLRALTPSEIIKQLETPQYPKCDEGAPTTDIKDDLPTYLQKWKEKRNEIGKAG